MRNDCVFCAIVVGNPAKVVRKLTAADKLKYTSRQPADRRLCKRSSCDHIQHYDTLPSHYRDKALFLIDFW